MNCSADVYMMMQQSYQVNKNQHHVIQVNEKVRSKISTSKPNVQEYQSRGKQSQIPSEIHEIASSNRTNSKFKLDVSE